MQYKNKENNFILRYLTNSHFIIICLIILVIIVLFIVPQKSDIVKYQNLRKSKITKYLESVKEGKSTLVINEIMYHPASNKPDDKYLEIYNTSDKKISLSEWRIKGIKYVFPKDAIINAKDYIVIAANPLHIQRLYDVPSEKVYGPYQGNLSKAGENIQLLRPDGTIEDEVYYSDSNQWDSMADGKGSSLELINPFLDNNNPQAWAASNIGQKIVDLWGTPGKVNSVYKEEVEICFKSVEVSPIIPTSKDKIYIICNVWNTQLLSKDIKTTTSMNLFYRSDSKSPFKRIEMAEKSIGDYYATIPQQADKTIIEFYLQGFTTSGNMIQKPESGSDDPYVIQVDDKIYNETIPVCRLIMSHKNLKKLTTRDVKSDEPLQATFIADSKIYLDTTVRYHGYSSRRHWKKSYRLEFPNNNKFKNRSVIFINAQWWENQYIGACFYPKAGMPVPEISLTKLILNGEDYQTFTMVEPIRQEYLDKWFPGNSHGNLYRGLKQANLDYRGEDKEKYRENYKKVNNTEEDNYNDIIELSRAFSEASDDNFLEQIKQVIDFDEWLTYFACSYATANLEGIPFYADADDYYLYCRPNDNKFVILPWDFDSILLNPMVDFRPTKISKNVMRFLNHPDVLPELYKKILKLSNEHLDFNSIEKVLSPIKPYLEAEKNYPKDIYGTIIRKFKNQISVIKSLLPQNFTADIKTSYEKEIIPKNSNWEICYGWNPPPANWTDISYNEGFYNLPAGFGFNWIDLKSYVDFTSFNSIYIRKIFTLNTIEDINNLRLCVDYSGGFIAYLNNKEIIRKYIGGDGESVSNEDYAIVSKKMANTEVFSLEKYKSLLKKGKNVLAIEAHPISNDLPYYVIHPWLIYDKENPYKSIIGHESKITIGGNFPIIDTYKILVNNKEANMLAAYGEWAADVELKNGWNNYDIQVFDKLNNKNSEIKYNIFYSPTSSEIGGEIQSNLVLSKEKAPYFIQNDIIIPKDKKVKIEAGCVLIFSQDTAIYVMGELQAIGSDSEPITFTPIDKISGWHGIFFKNSDSNNILKFCNIEKAWGRPGFSQGNVAVISSKLLMEDCNITDAQVAGIDINKSEIKVNRCRIKNVFSNYSGDGIKARGKGKNAIIQNCLIENLNGDGIDMGDSDIKIEKVIIRNAEDKGISLDERSEPKIDNLFITKCKTGLGIKDDKPIISNMVIWDCSEGITFYTSPERQNPLLRIKKSVIWSCSRPLVDYRHEFAEAEYCSVQGFSNIPGKGNVSIDPMFTDPYNGKFQIFVNSPINKAGENGDPLIDLSWFEEMKWE